LAPAAIRGFTHFPASPANSALTQLPGSKTTADVMIMMMDGYFGHRLDNEKAGLQSNSGMCFFFPTLSLGCFVFILICDDLISSH
jgi:hypothetical protein